jgi:hypothetical protein
MSVTQCPSSPCRPNGEHEGHPTTFVVKAAVAHQELPSSVPLGSPRLGEAFEHVIVGDLDGVALDHDVEPFVPVVAAGRQNHVCVHGKRNMVEHDGLLSAKFLAERICAYFGCSYRTTS